MSARRQELLKKNANDVVIISALRTPITRAKKGGFKDTLPEDLLSAVLKATIERTGIDPSLIEDVAVGNVLPAGGGANVARMAQLHAGIPNTCALNTLNRQCSSGLAAVAQIANEIATGQISIGIGAGVESMTAGYGGGGTLPAQISEDVLSNQEAKDCMIPMGITSENVAKDYGITREEQDRFAANSYAKAAAAQKAGKFKAEIVPVRAKSIDAKGESSYIIVDSDDGIRDGVTYESLSKLKPAFSKDGATHAGNASQVSDGAACVLLARRSVAEKLGLKIIGKFITAVTIGVPPRVMGIGPAFAIPKALKVAGLSPSDVDWYEINEAFASQAVMSIKHLGLDFAKVNPSGGAIAFGHPLGATGARQLATAFAEGARNGKKIFVSSMCMGSGMGMASIMAVENN